MQRLTSDIFSTLSSGIYAIGVKNDHKVSACIVNSVVQVSSRPDIIAVSVNRNNYSCKCISDSGIFTVSVLSEDTSGAVIGALGYNSGKDTDKLKNVRYRVLAEGVPVIKENICCWFLCRVVNRLETRNHVLFLAEILAGSETIKRKPMTFDFFRRVVKGRAPQNSPSYREEKNTAGEMDKESWICTICGYVYSDRFVPFEELPDEWICPICGAPKLSFRRKE